MDVSNLDQHRELHERNELYGSVAIQYAPLISEICNNLEIRHLLDYGCGKAKLFSNLAVNHPMTLQAYDPAVPQFSKPPAPAEFVTCIDVLEHIEPDEIDAVLDDLKRLTDIVLFVSVCTTAAMKSLPDGRNAHLIQQPLQWWLPKLWERFELGTVQMVNQHNFYVIAHAFPRVIENQAGEKIGPDH